MRRTFVLEARTETLVKSIKTVALHGVIPQIIGPPLRVGRQDKIGRD